MSYPSNLVHLRKTIKYLSATSATSFWKVRVSLVRPKAKGPVLLAMCSSHLMMSGVDTLKGRFPMMWRFGGSDWEPSTHAHLGFSKTNYQVYGVCFLSNCSQLGYKGKIKHHNAFAWIHRYWENSVYFFATQNNNGSPLVKVKVKYKLNEVKLYGENISKLYLITKQEDIIIFVYNSPIPTVTSHYVMLCYVILNQ